METYKELGYLSVDELTQEYSSLLVAVENKKLMMGLSLEEIRMWNSVKNQMITDCLNKFNNDFETYIENKQK